MENFVMKKNRLIFVLLLVGIYTCITCLSVSAEDNFWEKKWYPSKYGPNDTRGALNLITPEKTKQALKLIKKHKVYDLGMEYYDGFPAYPPRYWKTWILFHGVKNPLGTNKVTYMEEVCNISLGIGTQIDGLGHIGIGDKYYNGFSYKEIAGASQLNKFGIEKITPIITRGILLDMTAYKRKSILGKNEEITAKDVIGCLKKQRIKIQTGDAVLFYTGWSKLIETDPEKFNASEPGPSYDAAKYLVNNNVSMVGADTWGMECVPNPNRDKKGWVFPVHTYLLPMNGVHILENFKLDELAKDKVYEFCLILTAPKMRGMVQAILQPIAIR
jgi:kynurenine formamidase